MMLKSKYYQIRPGLAPEHVPGQASLNAIVPLKGKVASQEGVLRVLENTGVGRRLEETAGGVGENEL